MSGKMQSEGADMPDGAGLHPSQEHTRGAAPDQAGDETIVPSREAKESGAPAVDLAGKVALIVGGASENGRSLAVAFAERGMDVAIIHFDDADFADTIQREVEARDQRCLLIRGSHKNDDEASESFSRKAMERIINAFGRLDVFVNYSANTFPFNYLLEHETQRQRALRSQFFPHFPVMKAALKALAG